MTTTTTKFRLAHSGGEWNRLYALAKRAGIKVRKGDLSFPTIVAEREGKVVGYLSTVASPMAVIAGPFVVETRNPFLFLRLADAYENVMRLAGVKTFLFPIMDDSQAAQLGRLGMVRISPRFMRRDVVQ